MLHEWPDPETLPSLLYKYVSLNQGIALRLILDEFQWQHFFINDVSRHLSKLTIDKALILDADRRLWTDDFS